jgi:hypothetical protein
MRCQCRGVRPRRAAPAAARRPRVAHRARGRGLRQGHSSRHAPAELPGLVRAAPAFHAQPDGPCRDASAGQLAVTFAGCRGRSTLSRSTPRMRVDDQLGTATKADVVPDAARESQLWARDMRVDGSLMEATDNAASSPSASWAGICSARSAVVHMRNHDHCGRGRDRPACRTPQPGRRPEMCSHA